MKVYELELQQFRNAVEAWNAAGEPQHGPLFDQLDTARERFIRAQCPDATTEEHRSSA